jgi:predicted RNA binding protein YcfA (HicA-like mRNA interferase family)
MPQVTAQDLIRFLKSQGFVEDRQAGSHLTLWHAGRSISVMIPVHTGVILAEGLTSEFSRMRDFRSMTTFACAEIVTFSVMMTCPSTDDTPMYIMTYIHC